MTLLVASPAFLTAPAPGLPGPVATAIRSRRLSSKPASSFPAAASSFPAAAIACGVALGKKHGCGTRCSLSGRSATATPELWKPFPAEMQSTTGQKLVWLMKENPMLVDDAVEGELERLSEEQREAERAEELQTGKEKTDALVLQKRVREVQASERRLAVAELMYVVVCRQLQKLGAPPVKAMKEGGWISLGSFDIQSLTTDIYSADALEMVKDHLFKAIITQGAPGEPVEFDSPAYGNQIAGIALFTCAQMYAMSILFGYFLRSVDKRFKLEKMMGSLASGTGLPDLGDEDAGEKNKSLKEYIEAFDPTRLQQESLLTAEAQLATEAQVMALFGDLKKLQEQLMETLGPPDPLLTQDDIAKKVQEAIQMGKVPSLKISVADLRRVVLEAVAFGALLKDSEANVEGAAYELTPGTAVRMERLGSGEDAPPGM